MPFSDRKDEVIELRQSGLTTTQIAERCGVCAQLVSRYLIDWGYRTRKRDDTDWAKATIRRPVNPKAVKRFEPGKQYGDYTFLETIHGATTLHQFRHKCGWVETFTEFQWRERTTA